MFADIGLHSRLLDRLEAMSITEPTAVQQEALPKALAGRDLQLSSETGSGKTLVYILPLLNRLLNETQQASGTVALMLMPTRELAQQVQKLIEQLLDGTRITSVLISGGQEFRYQAALLRRDPEIIVATPGRLTEHVQEGSAILGTVSYLVLDEADRMLDMGFRDEVMEFVRACSADRQTMVLSATLKHRGIGRIAGEILKYPETVSLADASTPQTGINQQIILVDDTEHKCRIVLAILAKETFNKAIIFANKRSQVDALHRELDGKLRINRIHGEVTQDDRKRILGLFRQGAFQVLIATDVAARGLDIDGLDLVINFDMPSSGDEYVHRIGRTGRAGAEGLAISLVASYEWNLAQGIQRYLKRDFERIKIPGLEARFTGPKKVKKSGKAAGSKSKKLNKAAKSKLRHRDKKNLGKRRKPAQKTQTDNADGMSPPKKK